MPRRSLIGLAASAALLLVPSVALAQSPADAPSVTVSGPSPSAPGTAGSITVSSYYPGPDTGSGAKDLTFFLVALGDGCPPGPTPPAAAVVVLDHEPVASAVSLSVNTQTLPHPGSWTGCAYLTDAAGSLTASNFVAVQVAPGATAPGAVPAGKSRESLARPCVAPSLKGLSLARAGQLLAVGHCRLGRVLGPSKRSLRVARRRGHGRMPSVVVVSQNPAAATALPNGSRVSVRLALVRLARHTKSAPRRRA